MILLRAGSREWWRAGEDRPMVEHIVVDLICYRAGKKLNKSTLLHSAIFDIHDDINY